MGSPVLAVAADGLIHGVLLHFTSFNSRLVATASIR
jgi:hypothetical protein